MALNAEPTPITQLAIQSRLTSTTVRFIDEDLRLITKLKPKLRIGMIQVLRIAIRQLAANVEEL